MVSSAGLIATATLLCAPNITGTALPPTSTRPPAPLYFHIPFNGAGDGGHAGCCADINAITEHNGIKHLFKQSGGVKDPTSHGLGFAHYISDDFVCWKYVSTVVTPGGADGSLTFGLPGGPVILWDCTSKEACISNVTNAVGIGGVVGTGGRWRRSRGCKSGDAAIIGVARPVNASDPRLEHWEKDSRNPIVVGPAGTQCYAGPSNLWSSVDKKTTFLEMILNTTTGLFKSNDPNLHTWDLVNGNFYPIRGGGGGLFYPLPKKTDIRQVPAAAFAEDNTSATYTHMLQSDFPGHADGTAFYALGIYDEAKGTFDGATGPHQPRALDFSQTYVYNQLGFRADGRMVNVGWIRDMGTSVVREVTYDPTMGGQLLAYPVAELESLRVPYGKYPLTRIPANDTHDFCASCGGLDAPAVDVELELALRDQADEVFFTITALALDIEISIVKAAHGSGCDAKINMKRACTSTEDTFKAQSDGSGGTICAGTFPLPGGLKTFPLRLLIDGPSIEVFAASGRGVCSFAHHQVLDPNLTSGVKIKAGDAPIDAWSTSYRMNSIHPGSNYGCGSEKQWWV